MKKKGSCNRNRHPSIPALDWLKDLGAELGYFLWLTAAGLRHPFQRVGGRFQRHRLVLLLWALACMVFIGLLIRHQRPALRTDVEQRVSGEAKKPEVVTKITDIYSPVRAVPKSFPRNHRMPGRREINYSVSIDKVPFNPELDLVRVDDSRVWWESEHDRGDTEDDHLMHRSMEIPLRRLIELVSLEGGTLKVQDAYRDTGIHTSKSLHKQGRAIDLTCDELGLERLAALTWAAGFDWVYHEAPSRGGHHVHASVRPD
jgi:hypothetical protein